MSETRAISWVRAARKDFDEFPVAARKEALRSLTIAAEGRKAENTKPLTGLGSGVFEIVLRHNTDAYRVVYATRIGEDVWVVHSFQKKSKSGIRTPQHEVELVRARIKRLKDMLS